MEKERINTGTEEIWLRDDGIVHARVLANYFDIEAAGKYVEAVKTVGGNQKRKVFLDLRGAVGASQEARNYVAKEGAKVHSAMAILTDNKFSKMLGNFFIGFSKPLYPTKIFTNPEEAEQWLNEIKTDD